MQGIDAKAEQGIGNVSAKRIQPREGIAHPASLNPFGGRIRTKDRVPKDHGLGMGFRGLDKSRHIPGMMLAIRIHCQRVRESLLERLTRAMKKGRALAFVSRAGQYPDIGMPFGKIPRKARTGVGAAINDDPDGMALPVRRRQNLRQLRAAIEAGNQDEIFGRHLGIGGNTSLKLARFPASVQVPLPREMRKPIIIALQCAVTVVLLVWIFENETLRKQIGTLVARADLTWVWIGVIAALIGNIFGVIRWWIYLRALEMHLTFMRAVELYFIGAIFNSVMVGMVGGDVVKMGYLMAEGYRKTAVVMSVMLDRISGFGALAFAAIFFPVIRWDWFHQNPRVVDIMWFSLISVAVTFVGLTVTLVGAGTGLVKALPDWLPFREQIERVSRSYFVLASHWVGTIWASLISAVMLALYFLTFYAAARALGLNIGFFDFSSIMPMVDIIVSMPISIGGLGLREKIFETLMGYLWNIPMAEAVMVSLGGYLFMAAGGLPGLVFLPLYKGLLKKEGKALKGPC